MQITSVSISHVREASIPRYSAVLSNVYYMVADFEFTDFVLSPLLHPSDEWEIKENRGISLSPVLACVTCPWLKPQLGNFQLCVVPFLNFAGTNLHVMSTALPAHTIIRQGCHSDINIHQPGHPGHPDHFVSGHYGIPGVAMQGVRMHVPIVGGKVQMQPQARVSPRSKYVHQCMHYNVEAPCCTCATMCTVLCTIRCTTLCSWLLDQSCLRLGLDASRKVCHRRLWMCFDIQTHVEIPRFTDVSQSGAVDAENQDFAEEDVVDLHQARRYQLVQLARLDKEQNGQQGQQQLELELQELREKNYLRQRAWMDQKKSLKQEIGRFQIKVNAITGLNRQTDMQKLLSHFVESRADVEDAFSKRAGANIQFSEDGRIGTRW